MVVDTRAPSALPTFTAYVVVHSQRSTSKTSAVLLLI
jgi:hypothetical protein